MSRMLKRPSASSQERTNPNDSHIFIAIGEPLVAIESFCGSRRTAGAGTTKEPCVHTVLALVCGVVEISDSFFVAGEHRQSHRMAFCPQDNASAVTCRDGSNRAALCVVGSSRFTEEPAVRAER